MTHSYNYFFLFYLIRKNKCWLQNITAILFCITRTKEQMQLFDVYTNKNDVFLHQLMFFLNMDEWFNNTHQGEIIDSQIFTFVSEWHKQVLHSTSFSDNEIN